jgi:hypothetical protein
MDLDPPKYFFGGFEPGTQDFRSGSRCQKCHIRKKNNKKYFRSTKLKYRVQCTCTGTEYTIINKLLSFSYKKEYLPVDEFLSSRKMCSCHGQYSH